MPVRVPYHTKQLAELEQFMQTVPDRHVTVQEICAYFKERGKAIGTTTVYRQLDRLVAEGKVAKYTVDSGKSACFEYLGDAGPCAAPHCFHCKCEVCGALIHLHCHELDALAPHLLADHGFALDPRRTVLYGLCQECRGK